MMKTPVLFAYCACFLGSLSASVYLIRSGFVTVGVAVFLAGLLMSCGLLGVERKR